jgi:signal transduction histidine kinase
MQKIEAIGSFAGGIAHDFNNMISIIQSHCDLLLAQDSHSDSTRDELNNILEATQNAGALTGQLLTFSKKHVQNPEKINLNLTVRSMSGMIERIIPKNIELNLDLDEQLKDVYVDPSQIGQVIMNLISNAIDAMPDGGKLKISTRNVESRTSIKLSVQDTGIGMTEHTKKHLFEPYFSDKKVKGTGLGLAISYRIIQESSGKIEFQSILDQGTIFNVYLPFWNLLFTEQES